MIVQTQDTSGSYRGIVRKAFAVLLPLALLLAACGGGDDGDDGDAEPDTATEDTDDDSTDGAGADGEVRFATTWTGDTDALRAIVETFTDETGIAVNVNEVDGPTFSDQITSYLQGTPDDIFTWFGGYRMRYYADQGLLEDLDEVWDRIGDNYSEGYRTAATGTDGSQYMIPFYTYPWVVMYRVSVFEEHGYEVPETLPELMSLGEQMEADGLTPFAFANQDGWPAMGWFDILNMRVNGYQFHVDLLAGEESWTDPRVEAVFEQWQDLLPLYGDISAALGRTWEDGAGQMFNGDAGMLFFGTFAGTQADEEVLADLDFFAFPTLGTEFDDEMAIDAPINGFTVSSRSPSLEDNRAAVMEFAEYLGSGDAQAEFLAENPNFVAAADDTDTSRYVPLQHKMAEIIGEAGAIAQFLDRDTDPAFATEFEAFLQNWLADPDQDIGGFLQGVQDFWDSLSI